MLSRLVIDFLLVQLFVTPWTVACQSPLSLGILQARILEWVVMPSSTGSSQPKSPTLHSLLTDTSGKCRSTYDNFHVQNIKKL